MKLLLQGYSGKMGSLVYEEIKKEHDFLVLVDREHPLNEETIDRCDLALDFSSPDSAYELGMKVLQHQIPFISGTTGLTLKMIRDLDLKAKENQVGAYLISNFDPSLQTIIAALKGLDGERCKVTIIEYHNCTKRDCPSGTALTLAAAFRKASIRFVSWRLTKYLYRHIVRIEDQNKKIVLEHVVRDRRVYCDGVRQALETIDSFIGLKTDLS